MTGGNSLINLGNLSKPATILIEKISDAIGVMYEPTRVRNEAKAESDAVKIKKLAELDLLDEVEQRAVTRLLIRETKNQENIEFITNEALNNLNEDAKPEDIEDDWLSHFFEKCKIVSDIDMKNLWSRVLAGEANSPGSFSRRTVEFIATMDKKDADNFTNLCRYVVVSGHAYLLILELESSYFLEKQISFSLLTHMDDIGLISFNSLGSFASKNDVPKLLNFHYGPSPFTIEMANDSGNTLKLGKVTLSHLGKELFKISGATIDDTFLPYLRKEYGKSGVKVIF